MLRPRNAARGAAALAGACFFASCSHDWDAYDPLAASAASSGAAGSGGAPATSSSTGGGASGTGGAGGSTSAGGGGMGGGEPGSVHCAAHFSAAGSYLRRVLVDPAGGIVVAGPVQGGADFGGGLLDTPLGIDTAAIAKLDASCQHLWSHVFPGTGGKTYFWSAAMWPGGDVAAVGGLAGAADFGGGVLTPVGNEDTLLVRFDSDGNHVWSKAYGLANAGQWPQSAAVDPSEDVLVFGVSYGGASFGGHTMSGNGLFLVKIAGADGTPIWFHGFPGPDGRARSVVTDETGAIFVTGRFSGTMDFGGVQLTSAGGGRDGFVVKLDSDGDTVWARRFGDSAGANSDYGHAVALSGSGGLVLTGRFDGNIAFDSGSVTSAGDRDIFLAGLDGMGTSKFTRRFGGAGYDSALTMAVDASSHIVLAGRFEGTTDLGGVALISQEDADAFVARYDADGNHVWSRAFGGLGKQTASSVAVDPTGKVVATGYFDGTMAVEGRTFTATGGDGFVLVLWP